MSISRNRHRAGSAAGFTLIEVLVAFTIMSVALAVLFQSFGGGMRGVESAGVYVGAAAEARSILQRVGVDIPIRPGDLSGDLADGNRWNLSIEPYASTDLRGGETEGRLALYSVTVAITEGDRPLVAIDTLRLGPPQ